AIAGGASVRGPRDGDKSVGSLLEGSGGPGTYINPVVQSGHQLVLDFSTANGAAGFFGTGAIHRDAVRLKCGGILGLGPFIIDGSASASIIEGVSFHVSGP